MKLGLGLGLLSYFLSYSSFEVLDLGFTWLSLWTLKVLELCFTYLSLWPKVQKPRTGCTSPVPHRFVLGLKLFTWGWLYCITVHNQTGLGVVQGKELRNVAEPVHTLATLLGWRTWNMTGTALIHLRYSLMWLRASKRTHTVSHSGMSLRHFMWTMTQVYHQLSLCNQGRDQRAPLYSSSTTWKG